jgi:hypothetical protein
MMGHQHTRRSRLATTSHLFAAVERRNRRKSLPLAIVRVGSWYALEKKEENYLAFLHLACAQLIFAKILVFG